MEENNNWRGEGSQLYTIAEAMAEAQRCLNCPKPLCRTGCPIENEIPDFIHQIALGNFATAHDIISRRSNLPTICGYICPKEVQCEGHCILNKAKKSAIKIGKLETFVANFINTMQKPKKFFNKKDQGRVAIIGSGPAGLAAAGDLARLGYDVEVFEQNSEPGGILLFGIPEFRLAKDIVRREITNLENLGVKFTTKTSIGKDISLNELRANFDAIFVAAGTTVPSNIWVDGLDNNGIIMAMDLLTLAQELQNQGEDPIQLAATSNKLPINKNDNVLVIGAGNVAMDAARLAKRLGTNTTVVYRRGQKNMTCLPSEYEEALEDGVKFSFYSAPNEVIGENGKVTGLKVEKQEILEDATMVPTGIFEIIPADKIIIAIGYKPDKSILKVSESEEILADKNGYITTVNAPYYGMTNIEGIFAAGDIVHQPATVVLAMREGKRTAIGIDAYIKNCRNK